MRCPFCQTDDDRVVDTRPSEDGTVIRRRRECNGCARRFTTHERLEELPLRVVKKTGEREPFSREKIMSGVLKALEKRPVSVEEMENLVDDIEREITNSYEREVLAVEIGELVMKRLRKVDAVAYVRFASVYRDFKEVDEFVREISSIDQGKRGRNGED